MASSGFLIVSLGILYLSASISVKVVLIKDENGCKVVKCI